MQTSFLNFDSVVLFPSNSNLAFSLATFNVFAGDECTRKSDPWKECYRPLPDWFKNHVLCTGKFMITSLISICFVPCFPSCVLSTDLLSGDRPIAYF